jgi:hypothetical protein
MVRDRLRSEGRELVAETEAFMSGRYAEWLIERHESVPAWAWTNLLAHGDVEQLRHPPQDPGPRPSPGREAWMQARAYAAGEVLDAVAAAGRPLLTVQREHLVPLERALSSRPFGHQPSPADWVSAVSNALHPCTLRRHSSRRA